MTSVKSDKDEDVFHNRQLPSLHAQLAFTFKQAFKLWFGQVVDTKLVQMDPFQKQVCV